MEDELRNLVLLCNRKALVRLIAIVVSVKPYQSTETDAGDSSTIMRGLLLEYHPNDTLRDPLGSPQSETGRSWLRWALQITRGLDDLQRCALMHLDLKPSHIVISANYDAVLIDINARAVTQGSLLPEMRELSYLRSQDLQSRLQNDMWAFGKNLSQMANVSCEDAEKLLLKSVASQVTAEAPSRVSLRNAISQLQPRMNVCSRQTHPKRAWTHYRRPSPEGLRKASRGSLCNVRTGGRRL